MRKFHVWLDKNTLGSAPVVEVLEFEDDTSMVAIDKACADCLDVMLSNEIYSGWAEVEEE